jgi:hypothetical protein
MNVQEAHKLICNNDHEDTIEAIKTWANCQEAEIDDAGDIWIANPQTGHWLHSDKVIEFCEWLKKQ